MNAPLFTPDDFKRVTENMDKFMADGTEITFAQGSEISRMIRNSGKRRMQVVILLQTDTELFDSLDGPINMGVLTAAIVGTVTEEVSNLILRKVAHVTNTALE